MQGVLESAVNIAEKVTGKDIDGDGDVGMRAAKVARRGEPTETITNIAEVEPKLSNPNLVNPILTIPIPFAGEPESASASPSPSSQAQTRAPSDPPRSPLT